MTGRRSTGSRGRVAVTSAAVAAAVVLVAAACSSSSPAVAPADKAAVQQHFTAFEAAVAAATTAAQGSAYATTTQERAGAANYVHQLAQVDLETELAVADPLHPQLIRDPDPFAVATTDPPNRSGIYNPDNVNYVAVISPGGRYQITGKRGNSADLTFQVVSGFPGDGSVGQPTALLAASQLQVNGDGSYVVNIGGQSQAGNWLPTTAATSVLAIRDTFDTWTNDVPDSFTIARVDQTAAVPTRLPTAALTAALDRAAHDVGEQGRYWVGFWGGLLAHLGTNTLIPPATTKDGLQTQVSVLGRFSLTPDQALLITVARSNAAYQGFELADVWGQTLPYGSHQSSLDAGQAQLGSDGRYHFVVSATDPGVPNWIDTQGQAVGFMFLRWQGLTGALPRAEWPSATLVDLAAVRSHLPPGTPSVAASQRHQQLVARQHALAQRFERSSDQAAVALGRFLAQLQADVGSSAFHAVFPATVP